MSSYVLERDRFSWSIQIDRYTHHNPSKVGSGGHPPVLSLGFSTQAHLTIVTSLIYLRHHTTHLSYWSDFHQLWLWYQKSTINPYKSQEHTDFPCLNHVKPHFSDLLSDARCWRGLPWSTARRSLCLGPQATLIFSKMVNLDLLKVMFYFRKRKIHHLGNLQWIYVFIFLYFFGTS